MKLKTSITLDPGHGGHDPGALSPRGLKEKDVALKVCLRTAALLQPVMPVHLTRSDDRFIELAERAAIANRNGCGFFLSVHCNSGPPGQGSGFEVFTTRGETAADPFAIDLFREFAGEFPGHAKRMDLSDGDEDKEADFAVLRHSRMPAALFELEFIHTERGHQLLSDPAVLERMARALARGIYRHASGGLELFPAISPPAAVAPIQSLEWMSLPAQDAAELGSACRRVLELLP